MKSELMLKDMDDLEEYLKKHYKLEYVELVTDVIRKEGVKWFQSNLDGITAKDFIERFFNIPVMEFNPEIPAIKMNEEAQKCVKQSKEKISKLPNKYYWSA